MPQTIHEDIITMVLSYIPMTSELQADTGDNKEMSYHP